MAVGQLLEYQYFPDQNLAIELMIVTHLKAEPIIYDYLTQLELKIGVKIGLICFDYKNKIVKV
ncbi:hypothetical protein PQ469_11880 [Mucilaginibacter sp. KACC 22773]|jgi:hypothetical protein|uniref:hypothetical protein n=1 Tax=Mucilaginibacter sp. KACC 22773 TaxID=3025671 RepID=UPI0023650EE2|nr:hypothetical protein [Mucilaginibacter sp. KACC 22773]WDF80705.1 hypothetical protein PQ469_11880 [Mucilaginibacter sp. KACC 22773]